MLGRARGTMCRVAAGLAFLRLHRKEWARLSHGELAHPVHSLKTELANDRSLANPEWFYGYVVPLTAPNGLLADHNRSISNGLLRRRHEVAQQRMTFSSDTSLSGQALLLADSAPTLGCIS